MTDIEILKNLPAGLPFPEASEILLARDGTVILLPEGYKWKENDRVVRYTNNYGTVELKDIPTSNYAPEAVTAEGWIMDQGYTPIRVITLLDLESKLAAASKTSQKLMAVRAWIDGLLVSFVSDPTPKSDWPPVPFSFEETTQDAFTQLNAQ